jgi:fibronectin type 3 domain-containing protein
VNFVDTSVELLTTYFYAVRALDQASNAGPRSQPVSVTTKGFAIPRNVRAIAGEQKITLTWTANTEPELTGYEILRFTDPTHETPDKTFSSVLTTYVDTPVTADHPFVYRVRAVGTANVKSELSPPVSAQATEAAPVLAAPRNVRASPGIGHITITWSANTEAELIGYRVMRYTDPAQTQAEATFATVNTTYVDSPLVSGQTYIYRVQAVGTNNEESERSLYASATVSDDQSAPGAPSDLIVSLDDANFQRVMLNWTAPTRDSNNNELTGLTSFEIYRSRDNNTSFALIATVSSDQVSYEDTSVELLTRYFYAIRAVDQNGNAGPRSQPVSVTTKGFAIPSNLRATAGEQKITLTWSANTEPELTGYEILRFTDPNQETPERTFSSVLTTYVDTPVTADQPFVYRVRAVGPSNVKSGLSTFVSAQATAPPEVLAAPRNVRATAGIEYITITWSANTEIELTGYRVMRYTDPAQTEAEAIFTTVHTTYIDAPLVAEQTYVYRVQAVGTNNEESELSLFASATVLIDDIPPATPGNFAAILTSTGTAIELRWDAPIRDADGGLLTGLTRYVIYRADSSNTVPIELTTVDAAHQMYLDTGLANRTIYRYQISAIDQYGNESARSSIQTVRTTDLIVAPPSNLRASYNDSGPEVNLTWTAPQEHDSFTVQRAVLARGASIQDLTDGSYKTLDFVRDTTSYSDTNITSGTIYVYRVLTNLSGRVSIPSNIDIVPVP